MKWTFIIREKFKVALLLASIMLLIGFTTVMQRSNIRDLRQSFSSIYYDRLIPATDIFYLTQNLYNKRLLMEELLYTEEATLVEPLAAKLDGLNDSIATLISRFEHTYLVKSESVYLREFKQRVAHYRKVEDNILQAYLTTSRAEARQLYETEGKGDLQQTIQFLGELTKIQSSVGLELFNDSHGIVSASDLVLTIQITIAIIIGVLAEGLVLTSRMVDRKNERYNLN